MLEYKTLDVSIKNKTASITINRPEKHNAFDDVVISELSQAFNNLGVNEKIRVIILTGNGKSFCAGADIAWMKKMIDFSYEENVQDAARLFDLMYTIDTCPKPVIARVNGNAMGGGTGLIAVCDISIAVDTAEFMLSNVKYGLFPAIIAPFIMKRIGKGKARELFLTGGKFGTITAEKIGLINKVSDKDSIDFDINTYVSSFLKAGPETLKLCKGMIHHAEGIDVGQDRDYHARIIAEMRLGEEGKQGFNKFLNGE